ncbi:MAG: hypothetical protein M1335_03970 [Chloroflexi bacterium]|nr:hypothetical protein [Chloroflexota bacterium]
MSSFRTITKQNIMVWVFVFALLGMGVFSGILAGNPPKENISVTMPVAGVVNLSKASREAVVRHDGVSLVPRATLFNPLGGLNEKRFKPLVGVPWLGLFLLTYAALAGIAIGFSFGVNITGKRSADEPPPDSGPGV